MRKLREISVFEVVLCIFVVMIHLLSECIYGYTKGTILSAAAFIFSRSLTFAVPAFIMASAIKMSNKFKTQKLNYIKFIKTRISKIYLPFILWSVIYYLYFVFFRNYFPFSLKDLFSYIVNGEIAAPFYFIIIIMQFYFLMPLWIKMSEFFSPKQGIFIAIVITILSKLLTQGHDINNRIFTNYFMFWITGMYIGKYHDAFLSYIEKYKNILYLFAFIFTATYVIMAYLEFMSVFHSVTTELVKLCFCLSVSIGLLHICHTVNCLDDIIKKLSPVTFYVYLIHCLIIFVTEQLLTDMGIISISLRFAIKLFAVYILSFSLALIYYNTKKRIKL